MIENDLELINKAKNDSLKWEKFQKTLYPKLTANIAELLDTIDSRMGILKTKELSTDEQSYLQAMEQKQHRRKGQEATPPPLKRR